MEKAFDRVPRKVLEWALRKKGIPEVLVRSVMSLYEGAWYESEWILSCQMSLKLMWRCTKDLSATFSFCSCDRCCH